MKFSTINRNILRLALPSIMANITVPLVGIVDLAIAGHLGDAASIGGIAIGSMLFDLLYWNMGFLRVGTGGITAQAYGRRDFKEAMDTFTRGGEYCKRVLFHQGLGSTGHIVADGIQRVVYRDAEHCVADGCGYYSQRCECSDKLYIGRPYADGGCRCCRRNGCGTI